MRNPDPFEGTGVPAFRTGVAPGATLSGVVAVFDGPGVTGCGATDSGPWFTAARGRARAAVR